MSERERRKGGREGEQRVAWRGAPERCGTPQQIAKENGFGCECDMHLHITHASYVLQATPPKPRFRSIRQCVMLTVILVNYIISCRVLGPVECTQCT
jgi:hypothetical protein